MRDMQRARRGEFPPVTISLGAKCKPWQRGVILCLLHTRGEREMQEQTVKLLETALSMDATVTDDERLAILDAVKNPAVAMADKLLTIKQAAEMLGIHEKTVWLFARQGKINIVPITNKARRVRYSDVKALIDGTFQPTRSYCPTKA